MLKVQKSMARGTKGVTAIFARGDIMDNCPKLTTKIGRLKITAQSVIDKLSLAQKKLGTNFRAFSIFLAKSIIQSVARKDS